MTVWRVSTPRDAALSILDRRFQFQNGSNLESRSALDLRTFQLEAVQHASSILDRRGGVLIADSVGLGKTFVGLALIERALLAEQQAIVVVPASLRAMWRRELKKLTTSPPLLISHTQLALGHAAHRRFDLVVVDEAHAFRNPRTRRYRALRLVCRGARVALITATPVNNSLADLYFQLRLFCSDAAFRDLGIGSLQSALTDGGRDMARILREVMVRRTRAEIRSRASPHGATPGFPREVVMHSVGYAMPVPPDQLGCFLGELTFPAYRIHRPDGLSPDLLRFAFLKRMESSAYAIRRSLGRQVRFYEQFISSLERGLLLRPAAFRSLFGSGDDALQLVLEGVTLEPHEPLPGFIDEARAELATLRAWLASVEAPRDDKLGRLLHLLAARPAGCRTIVFTEFRDTARYLWKALRRRFPTAMIDGGGAWIGESPASRRHVVERFAPAANGGCPVHPREAVSVLVATDVLAEGMNLQDADAVISYDLPWNPIRLVQRAGRIDRIGSPHDVVHIHNFLPDREFDAFIGLARTIRTKLETVRGSVGLERPVLEPGEDFEAVVRALRTEDAAVLNRVDAGRDAALRKAWEGAMVAPVCEARIARMTGSSGRRMLIGLERGAEWDLDLVCVESGRAIPAADTDALLLQALDDPGLQPFDVAPFQAAALQHLAAVERRSETTCAARSASSRVVRRIRDFLGELPLNAGRPDLFDRADRILELLAAGTADFDEIEIDRLMRDHGMSFERLLDSLENALMRGNLPAPEKARWVITAVIIAD